MFNARVDFRMTVENVEGALRDGNDLWRNAERFHETTIGAGQRMPGTGCDRGHIEKGAHETQFIER